MLTAISITFVIVAALGYALRSEHGDGELITHQPYNNRYSDATGAREDRYP